MKRRGWGEDKKKGPLGALIHATEGGREPLGPYRHRSPTKYDQRGAHENRLQDQW